MNLFEVIDLGDDDEPQQPISLDRDDENDIVVLEDCQSSVSPEPIDIDETSENDGDGGSVDAFDAIFISDDDSESDSDDVIFEAARTVRPKRPRNRGPNTGKRTKAPTETKEIPLDRLKINGLLLEPHINVQIRYGAMLPDRSTLGNGYFMRIKKIFQRTETYAHKDGTEITQTSAWVQGPLFRRHRELDGILPKTAGEVALLREKADVRASDVVNIRELILTNILGRDTVRKSYEDARDDAYGRLICRWKAKTKDNVNGKTGTQQLGATGYIRRLTQAEADPGYKISDMELSRAWRPTSASNDKKPKKAVNFNSEDTSIDPVIIDDTKQVGTVASGADSVAVNDENDVCIVNDVEPVVIDDTDNVCITTNAEPVAIDDVAIFAVRPIQVGKPSKPILIEDDGVEIEDLESKDCIIGYGMTLNRQPRRKYTFGDAFCGAGGATRGAVMAGFKVRWGVDHDEAAINSWRSNFGFSIGYQEDVHEFVTRHEDTYVDLLHLSPPCQFFSWARTIPGRNDEENEAGFFIVPNILNSCRPRAVTVEETDGLIGLSRSVGHFKCMLGDFTSMGYSVKYAILNAACYGVPSRRKRLVLIACCPGETLADFPNPTHFYSSDPFEPMPAGLKRAVTLREAIGRIPRHAPDHDIEILETVAPSSLKLPPHEWDQPFRSTIKCGGGEYNLHPSRNRKFTLRELACLQSFPLDHRFCGKKGEKMRQIGNAFPPRLVGTVMESVRKHLEKIDEEWKGGGIL
ncbi:uncharacterized protein DFL_001864 [Arthrobotrys flagrans]|uniref:DNA (cytosine-5-)-methyltransferase n=1 Tax=Arthrobotrys flagrans TaxID=97331 RepID=A0A437A8W3_ARTFL|nr:hypothetical protein DFL_001864 [Arthrobotrys flagrans]